MRLGDNPGRRGVGPPIRRSRWPKCLYILNKGGQAGDHRGKGLVKAIKAAYRHSGYTVLNQGGEVTIYTEGWFVRCLWTKLPRKALAIIVEHMGMIPDDGEAMAIEKDDQPQAVMAGIVSDDVAGWMGGEAASMASYVPVTFRGYQLFQEVNGRQAYGVDPTALAHRGAGHGGNGDGRYFWRPGAGLEPRRGNRHAGRNQENHMGVGVGADCVGGPGERGPAQEGGLIP